MQNKTTDDPPGAGLNIAEMAAKNVTCGQFPITNYEDIVMLQRNGLCFGHGLESATRGDQRLFWERIGFILYLQHYVTFLIPMAVLGIGTIIYNELLSLYGVTNRTALWCSFLTYSWRQPCLCGLHSLWNIGRDYSLSRAWNGAGFEDSEQDRPLFIGIETVSPVDGSMTRYFPSSTKQYRRDIVNLVITINILGVLVVFSGIIYFQIWAGLEENRAYFTWLDGTYLGDQIASIVSAVVIAVLNFLYSLGS